MASEVALLTIAVATTAAATLVPWLRTDELPRTAWERKTAFAILLGDAFYEWWAFAQAGEGARDPTWLATLVVLVSAGIAFAAFLLTRGYGLPGVVRWPLVVLLGLVEPVLMGVSFVAVNGPIPLW